MRIDHRFWFLAALLTSTCLAAMTPGRAELDLAGEWRFAVDAGGSRLSGR